MLEDLLVGHLPHAHAVRREAGAAVVEDRGDAAQQPALLHPGEVVEEALLGHPELGGGGRVGFRDDRHVALQRADHGDVELVVGLRARARSARSPRPRSASASVSPSISRSMRILNSFSVGSWRTDSAPASRASTSSVPSRPSSRVGLGGDREPQVELVVAQVVVRDAGVCVDHLRGAVRVLGVDLGGDEHRGVAERARVEDRRDLADDALVEQALHAAHHLRLARPRASSATCR